MAVKYSVVIVSYNSETTIERCINKIFQLYNEGDVEVIVVDNNSIDNTPDLLKKMNSIKLILNEDNLGFAKACNLGVENSQGEFLFFLNPDAVITTQSLERLSHYFSKTDQIAAVGPLSNYAAGYQNISGVYDPNKMGNVNLPEQAEHAASALRERFNQQALETKLLIGFALMIPAKVYHELGGMDEKLVLGLDDLDLSWRIKLAGKSLVVAYDVFVYHQGQVSFNAGVPASVEKMKNTSQVEFSKKLINHYGRVDNIPASREIWGIDWFQVSTDIEINEESISDNINAEINFCIICRDEEKGKENTVATVKNLRGLNISAENILVINLGSASCLGDDDLGVDEWSVSKSSTLQGVAKKISKWFERGSFFFIAAGMSIPKFQFKQLAGSELLSINYLGKTLDVNTGEVIDSGNHTIISQQQQLATIPNYYWHVSFDAITSDLQLQYKDNILLHYNSEKRIVAESVSQTNDDVIEQFPKDLQPFLKKYNRVGIKGKGQLLGLMGQPIQMSECDLIIYKITISDILGLSAALKELRQNDITEIVLLFDNGMYQDKNQTKPYPVVGPDPVDVKRELLNAGFKMTSIKNYNSGVSVNDMSYLNLQYDSSLRTEEENFYTNAQKIMMVIEPCDEKYDLTKKVSIVILALNKVEYTQKCIESIQKNTRQSYELILVNNGSTDGTLDYFSSVPNAVVIDNPKNLGVSAGWNQGVQKATGDYVLILNNDVIVGEQSIENLVRCSMNHTKAGIIAPRTNNIAGPQVDKDFYYQSDDDIETEIQRKQAEANLSCWEFSRIKGFCMLIPMGVVDQVGLFDEVFGYGNFEDDDYSCRVQYNGYDLLVADDSFIFHYGSVSFGQADIDWNEQMKKNMALFQEKWKKGRSSVNDLTNKHLEKSLPVRHEKSEDELNAWKLIQSQNFIDAKDLLLKLVAQQPDNPSLYFALGQVCEAEKDLEKSFAMYCRALELDENISEVPEKIVEFLNKFYSAEDTVRILEVLHRKHPGAKAFELVHENSAIRSDNLNWADEVESLIENKELIKAVAILNNRIEQNDQSFEVYNFLGIINYYNGEFDQAMTQFEEALKLNPYNEDLLINYYDVCLKLNLHHKAIEVLDLALAKQPDLLEARKCLEEVKNLANQNLNPEQLFQYRELNINAEKLIQEGMLDNAYSQLNEILTLNPNEYRALNNRGLIHWYRNERNEAYDNFYRATQVNLWYTDAIVNLFDASLLTGQLNAFKKIFAKARSIAPQNPEIIKIEQDLTRDDIPERLKNYFREEKSKEELTGLLNEGNEFLKMQKYDSAILIYTDILEKYPDNAECYNGLGIICFYWGRFDDAYRLFLKAVEINPLDVDTLMNLWDVSLKLDKQQDVKQLMEMALTMDPSLKELEEFLHQQT